MRRATQTSTCQARDGRLRSRLDQTLQTLSAKSDMAGGIRYALARWAALTLYLEDGTIEIDSNAAERALRVVARREKLFFTGSNPGGERAAAIYSLLGTAKLNGINPEHYLKYVRTQIADRPVNRIAGSCPGTFPPIAAQTNNPHQISVRLN